MIYVRGSSVVEPDKREGTMNLEHRCKVILHRGYSMVLGMVRVLSLS